MKNLIVSEDIDFFTKDSSKVVLESFLEYTFSDKYSTTRVNLIENDKEDFEYISSKYFTYLESLYVELNKLHKVEYSQEFWKKILGMGFYRLIYLSYMEFRKYEQINLFDNNLNFNNLDAQYYYTPNSFNDMREFIQYDSFGQEQLFSIYCSAFYANKSIDKIKKNYQIVPEKTKLNNIILKRIKQIFSQKLILKIIKKISNIKLFNKRIKVGLFEVYFSDSNFIKLIINSLFRISILEIATLKQENNTNKRYELFPEFEVIDKFDIYFQKVMISCMPKNIIENFNQNLEYYQNKLNKYSQLNYIINESFIGSHNASFMLAVAKEFYGIKHYYNEHNKLNHQYKYNINYIIANMVDKYLTLGWKNNDSLYTTSGSLYEYNLKGNKKPNIILHISSVGFSKASDFANSSFDTSAEKVIHYIKFRKDFFSNITTSIKKKIIYKGYQYNLNWKSIWNIDKDIKDQLNCYTGNKNAKELMLKSKLVIVDYQSTSHLESLSMNIPTVFFWIKGTYELEGQYIKEYNDLILCGICQTSPTEAASFVNYLVENDSIEKWWYSEKTQSARKKFLDENIGDPQVAIDFYLSLIKE